MAILESSEMYLETILLLSQKRDSVRSIDIAEEMGFSKPSVSRAMHKLLEYGFIAMDENSYITLTPTGRSLAEKIYERHTLIKELLMGIGVDEETADADACKIEHDISDAAFAAIREYVRHKE